MNRLEKIFKNRKPVIGMVHLRPLPGSPLYNPASMGMDKIIETAVREAGQLEEAGVDGVQVENMWDIPYVPGSRIADETVAALAVGVYAVSKAVSIPVGCECHMNGADKALAAAVAGGARWIRIFEYCNAFISQSGYIDAIGGKVARMRRSLNAEQIAFLCDINVKHGSHFIIHDRSIEEQALDVEAQDGDAIIVTGFDTGVAPSPERVSACKNATALPIFLGSGVTEGNIAELFPVADGIIIGSYFKKDGNWKQPVDFDRAKSFMNAIRELREGEG